MTVSVIGIDMIMLLGPSIPTHVPGLTVIGCQMMMHDGFNTPIGHQLSPANIPWELPSAKGSSRKAPREARLASLASNTRQKALKPPITPT